MFRGHWHLAGISQSGRMHRDPKDAYDKRVRRSSMMFMLNIKVCSSNVTLERVHSQQTAEGSQYFTCRVIVGSTMLSWI